MTGIAPGLVAARLRRPQRPPRRRHPTLDRISGRLQQQPRQDTRPPPQWKQSLGDAYCASIRKKAADAVATEDIVGILKPLWATKQETASRLPGRIEKVLDAAEARGWRIGENPARWRGHLDHLLPRRQKLQRDHQPAMPYEEVPAFVGRLRARDAFAAPALEFLILTAARSGEVAGAT